MKQNYPETTKKNSFIFYNSYKEHFQLIDNPQEALNLLYAIIDYSQSGKIPSLIGMAKMAFSFIKINIDNNNKKYQSICERNQKNGSLGGRPRTQKTQLVNQEPKKPDNDNDNDNDNDSDIDSDKGNDKEKTAFPISKRLKDYMPSEYKELFLSWLGIYFAIHGKMAEQSQEMQFKKLMDIPKRHRIQCLEDAIAGQWKNIRYSVVEDKKESELEVLMSKGVDQFSDDFVENPNVDMPEIANEN